MCNPKVLHGRPATMLPGSGKAVVLQSASFQTALDEKVIVARYATPDFAILFQGAAAAVFEEGGIACHAAILAREFGIPCIVGVSGLLDMVGDGDKIVLDPSKGEVLVYGP